MASMKRPPLPVARAAGPGRGVPGGRAGPRRHLALRPWAPPSRVGCEGQREGRPRFPPVAKCQNAQDEVQRYRGRACWLFTRDLLDSRVVAQWGMLWQLPQVSCCSATNYNRWLKLKFKSFTVYQKASHVNRLLRCL